MCKLYTIGYGRTNKVDFLERIAQIPGSGQLVIADVRRKGSKSTNGRWCWPSIWPSGSVVPGTMLDTLKEVGVEYFHWPYLAHMGNPTLSSFEVYRHQLEHGILNFSTFARWVASEYIRERRICILCAERKPVSVHGSPLCHRVILADVLQEHFGGLLQVEHIGIDEVNLVHKA